MTKNGHFTSRFMGMVYFEVSVVEKIVGVNSLTAAGNLCTQKIESRSDPQILIRTAQPGLPTKDLIFLFLNQNICCGYSKELSFKWPLKTGFTVYF